MDIFTLALSMAYSNKAISEMEVEGFKIQVETTRDILETAGKEKTFYFLPKIVSKPQNGYDEYIYVNNNWELMGSTSIDLSGYMTLASINPTVQEIEAMPSGQLYGDTVNHKGMVKGGQQFYDSSYIDGKFNQTPKITYNNGNPSTSDTNFKRGDIWINEGGDVWTVVWVSPGAGIRWERITRNVTQGYDAPPATVFVASGKLPVYKDGDLYIKHGSSWNVIEKVYMLSGFTISGTTCTLTWLDISSLVDLSDYYTKTEINNMINNIETLHFEIAQQRPLENIKTNTIYLIPSNNSENENTYDEYIYINDSWELIGNTSIDLSDYAPLSSPQLSGIPSAPTATYGTNTDQIATTAFVQQSLRPTVIVSVNDIPVGTTVSVTLTLMNSELEYSVTDTLDSSGLASFLLDWAGEYSVQFSNPQVKGHDTINVSIPRIYTYSADWTESITFTVLIDTTNSNPETACTYADDAVGMIKASSLWDRQPIFKQIKPCVFQNGRVNYYLNPNDWTKKRNSDEDSILTGEDGDIMIEFPKFAYKIKTENGIITVSISNDEAVIKNDSDYTYDAFSRLEEGDLDYFYKGAFKGSLDESGQLRSIIGTKPANSKNIGAFRAAAQSNGAHYQQSTYAQLKALQCLYLIKYGNRNGQAVVGNGVVSASASYVSGYNTPNLEDIETATNTLASGMTFGTTANSTTHMRLFGIEDFWGCIWEWVDGFTTDGNRNIITSWNNFSNEGVEPTTVSTPSGLASNASGWNKGVAGNTAAGFMPIEFGGSSSTFWADNGYLDTSCVLYFGGQWNYGGRAGPFVLYADRGASFTDAFIGARLSYV